jgi:hypothetical protein
MVSPLTPVGEEVGEAEVLEGQGAMVDQVRGEVADQEVEEPRGLVATLIPTKLK